MTLQQPAMTDFKQLRQRMIDYQLLARGLRDQAVLDAVNAVPREAFFPTELVEFAYSDNPLPIAASQTISQPYIVALMTAALELKDGERVLEVGTGSGYAAAILAEIAGAVYTIERHKILADTARGKLQELGYDNIHVLHGDGSLVLLGEASHGTAEFYDMRARITWELIEKKGFNIVAVEADWPDAAHIDHYIRGTAPDPLLESTPFDRFPTWMWANHSVLKFVHWLKTHNQRVADAAFKVGFYGLDLYSLYRSIEVVLKYLEEVDPQTAEVARLRYGCLMPWLNDPGMYGQVTMTRQYRECVVDVVAALQDLLRKRMDYSRADGERFFNVEQNARLVTNAERYYRTLYYAENSSWNQRDQHMFDTLMSVLQFRGPKSRAVIWEHNSHIGDARATQMSARGEFNIGQLVRQQFPGSCYLIGFGTDHGTVAAASEWGGPMEIKQVQPAHIDSYERVCHVVKTDCFLLPLTQPLQDVTRDKLLAERLERAIGVIYRPETELQSDYFYASLPRQFDEYIWFDETRSVEPLMLKTGKAMPDTFPFGL
jgi:protein-L-isoaspartate(D-aspartate) O-methyltransferase